MTESGRVVLNAGRGDAISIIPPIASSVKSQLAVVAATAAKNRVRSVPLDAISLGEGGNGEEGLEVFEDDKRR